MSTFDLAEEQADLARIPQQPYERGAPNWVSLAAISMAYYFVTGHSHSAKSRYSALADVLLHNGHGRMLRACSDERVTALFPNYLDNLTTVADAIRSVDETLAADYPHLTA